MPLSFINRDPTQPNTIFSAKCHAKESDRLGQKCKFVTFEQPLYIKAVGIVLLSPRLEGVILMLSFCDDLHGFNRLHDVRY